MRVMLILKGRHANALPQGLNFRQRHEALQGNAGKSNQGQSKGLNEFSLIGGQTINIYTLVILKPTQCVTALVGIEIAKQGCVIDDTCVRNDMRQIGFNCSN
jgi:hypothetical protein